MTLRKRRKTLDRRIPTEEITPITPKEKEQLLLPTWPDGLGPAQVRFLNAYSLGGSILRACEATGMSRSNPYRWSVDPDFSEALAQAKEAGVQRLEDWALYRATDQENPSDRLVEFLLKAARPEVYRERVDHRIAGSVEHRIRIILDNLEETEILKIETGDASVD